MMLRKFFYCCVVTVLANTSPCWASQPEIEFTAPEASPAPDAAAVTSRTPAAVTRQPTLQETLAASLLKRRAATGDEAETENESGAELRQLRGDVKKLTDLVNKFEKQVRVLEGELELVRNAAEANKALDEDDKELNELEKGQLLEEIINLKRRALQAEEETRQEKALREAQTAAEKENIRAAMEKGLAQAKELFAAREAELLAELDRRNEELRLAREAQAVAENMLKELRNELKADRERMQKTEQTLSDIQNDRAADRKRMEKLEEEIKSLKAGAAPAREPSMQQLVNEFVVLQAVDLSVDVDSPESRIILQMRRRCLVNLCGCIASRAYSLFEAVLLRGILQIRPSTDNSLDRGL